MSFRWEELDEKEYSDVLDRIMTAYDKVREIYKDYVDKNLTELHGLTISGLKVDLEKDMNATKGLMKSEKNGKQNSAISEVLEKFKLIGNKVYIEFGAGKGGLSHYINSITGDKSLHILLEREGVRYKMDKHSDNLVRVMGSC